ncbi:hypothetical protein JWS13_27465 [Rhodococcus pseudokoreensis]|uniref:EthD domain-containing protein n=1 Tax=Rhodococcus pseudokoreensis TaxID=2811421 RepID=A0A974W7I9_9NOCA|nr:hypothetical protein [Rhodococcus pseudokoreensis]QSE92107.1 hypothetical protein JWS13_27465 [Rhodococcus pseudokoreensis]
MAKGILLVLSNATETGNEEEFNRWYNEVHAPEIVQRGAAVSFRRFKSSGVPLGKGIPEPGQEYACVYEIEAETVEDVEAIAQRLEQTKDQSQGVSPDMDLTSVRASFMVPVTS